MDSTISVGRPRRLQNFPVAVLAGFETPLSPSNLSPRPKVPAEASLEGGSTLTERTMITADTRVTMGCWEDMKRDIIQRAFDHLAPGGYLECQEISSFIECDDGTMPETYPIREIFAELTEIARIEAHRPLDVAEHLRAWFEEVGFVDVHQEVFRVPLNGWPRDEFMKEIGNAWKWNVSTGLPAFSLALLSRFREMTEAQIQVGVLSAPEHQHYSHGLSLAASCVAGHA